MEETKRTANWIASSTGWQSALGQSSQATIVDRRAPGLRQASSHIQISNRNQFPQLLDEFHAQRSFPE